MNDASKSRSRSVSLPEGLWQAIDAFVPTVHHDRSSWIKGLATDALTANNALPDDPVQAELMRTKELIAVQGLEAVRRSHDDLVNSSASSEGEGS